MPEGQLNSDMANLIDEVVTDGSGASIAKFILSLIVQIRWTQ